MRLTRAQENQSQKDIDIENLDCATPSAQESQDHPRKSELRLRRKDQPSQRTSLKKACKKMAEWLEHGENSRLEDGLLEHAEVLVETRRRAVEKVIGVVQDLEVEVAWQGTLSVIGVML